MHTGTPEEKYCSNISHQDDVIAIFPDGVASQLPALTVTIVEEPGDDYRQDAGIYYIGRKSETSTECSTNRPRQITHRINYLDNICFGHAETDLDAAIQAVRNKYKACLRDRKLVLNFFGKAFKEVLKLPPSLRSPKVVQHFDRAKIDFYRNQLDGIKYDKRCIHTIVGWTGQGECDNLSYDLSMTADPKVMKMPAYVVIHQGNPEQVLGCICYRHAVVFEMSIRMIVDSYADASLTLNDIQTYVCWDSNGQVPELISEEDYQLQYQLNPKWQLGMNLSKKWEHRGGIIARCKCCKVKQWFEYHSKSPICAKCAAIKKAEGCMTCKTPITGTNTHIDFPIDLEDGYLCRD
ncbi:MAG: hypothetical protein ACMG6E_06105, partial [Candidatus Roizmanbacteria bacterium]